MQRRFLDLPKHLWRSIFAKIVKGLYLFNIFTKRLHQEKYTGCLQKQPTKMFCKKSVPKNFWIFTEKHLCWSHFLIKLQAFRHLQMAVSRCFGAVIYGKHFLTLYFLPLRQCTFVHFTKCPHQKMRWNFVILRSEKFAHIYWRNPSWKTSFSVQWNRTNFHQSFIKTRCRYTLV